jgi:hypothetical protein
MEMELELEVCLRSALAFWLVPGTCGGVAGEDGAKSISTESVGVGKAGEGTGAAMKLLQVLLVARQVEEGLVAALAHVLISACLRAGREVRTWSSCTCWCCFRLEPEVKDLLHFEQA